MIVRPLGDEWLPDSLVRAARFQRVDLDDFCDRAGMLRRRRLAKRHKGGQQTKRQFFGKRELHLNLIVTRDEKTVGNKTKPLGQVLG